MDPMAAALYDRFHVGVSAIQVLLATAKAEWRLPKVQQRLQLVYQFGLDLSLYTCILPPGGHPFEQLVVTAALAEGDAPSLSLRLSSPSFALSGPSSVLQGAPKVAEARRRQRPQQQPRVLVHGRGIRRRSMRMWQRTPRRR